MISWHSVQTFNSVSQSPCTVAGYMMATCYGGCKLFSCLHVGIVGLSSLQLMVSLHYHQGIHTRATTTSAYAVQSDIRSSVHAPDARDRNRLSAIIVCRFSIPRAYGFLHFLAGLPM